MARKQESLASRQRWMRDRHAPQNADTDLREAGVYTFEPHFTVAELSEQWSLSRDAVRRMFEDEPGVLKLGDKSRPGRRRYTTLRIPRSVAERVYRRHIRV